MTFSCTHLALWRGKEEVKDQRYKNFFKVESDKIWILGLAITVSDIRHNFDTWKKFQA
jgi:hypothetical protein